MKDSQKTALAVAALLLSAAYATAPLWSPGGSPGARPAEAAGSGMIAFRGADPRDGKVYVVDAGAKVILVFAASQGKASFNLVAGRSYAADVAIAANPEYRLPFDRKGYSVKAMKDLIDKPEGGRP